MKVIATSDCHGALHEVSSELEGNVLILAGDVLPNIHPNKMIDALKQEAHLEFLDDLVGKLSIKHTLMIAGNHDWLFQYNREAVKKLKNITYLEDQEIIIDGVKFYGSPWQPFFLDWAFNLPRDGEEMERKWSLIPNDTQVLITHGPPYGILDKTPGNEDVGCKLLLERVLEIKPKIHVFGHIHNSYGRVEHNGTLYLNVSLMDEDYEVVNKPQKFEI